MNYNFVNIYEKYEKFIDLRLKTQSKRSIKNRFKVHIIPYFQKYNVNDISELDYLNWQLEIEKKGYSYKYKTSLHIAIVSFLNFCITYYNLEKNVASKVGNFKKKNIVNKGFDFYNIEEFNLFINSFDNNVYKQFFNFMFFVGTRPGETMALKFSDLNNSIISITKTIDERNDSDLNIRVINSPKSFSSIRDIAIDDELNNNLLKLKEYYIEKYNTSNFDFYIFGGLKPLAPTTINRYKEKACKKANIRQIKLHEFRHSHATLLVENKIMINEISRRLGHSDVSITLNTYVHTDKTQEKRVINTLNSLRKIYN